MGKRKDTAAWAVVAQGLALTAGIYLAGILLLTLLLVRGALPESGAYPVLAVVCLAAALGGGFLCARRSRWGTLPSALLCAGLFAGILAAVGVLLWREDVLWLGQGGGLLLCALAGGLLAGLLAVRRPRRKRRR